MAGQGCLCAIVGKCNVHKCFLGIYCVNYVCIKAAIYIMCGPVSWRRLSSINNPHENALTLYNTCAIIIIIQCHNNYGMHVLCTCTDMHMHMQPTTPSSQN